MQIVLCEKIRWIRLFNTSIKGNFNHINMQCARNIQQYIAVKGLLLKMTVVSEQMAMLWCYFIITMLEILLPFVWGYGNMNFVIMSSKQSD